MSTTDDIQPDGERGLLKLVRGRLDLRLAPQVGGCIAAFNYLSDEKGKTPILRGADAVPSSVLDAASFPLVPYSNRVRNGRFRFRGREVTLAPNMAGDPSPLHGQGWLAAYSATKFGVVGFTQALHKEHAGDGIQATALCPGFVDTAMTDWVKESVPSEKMIQPTDIAEAVRYLLRTSPACIVPELQFVRPGEAL